MGQTHYKLVTRLRLANLTIYNNEGKLLAKYYVSMLSLNNIDTIDWHINVVCNMERERKNKNKKYT